MEINKIESYIKWCSEAAHYFENRKTNGEDLAHWSNVINAQTAREISSFLRTIKDHQNGN